VSVDFVVVVVVVVFAYLVAFYRHCTVHCTIDKYFMCTRDRKLSLISKLTSDEKL